MVETAVSVPPAHRRPVAVWATLLALLAAIAAVELAERTRGDGAPDRSAYLLPMPVEELGALELARAGGLHRFERDAAGAWFYHGAHGSGGPAHAHAADPERARFLAQMLEGFGRARIERRFPSGAASGRYGVAAPGLVVLAYRTGASAPAAQYAIGDVAPDRLSRYVLAAGSGDVLTIADFHIDNLLALIR